MKSTADSMGWWIMLGCIAARQGRRDEAARYDRLLAASEQGTGRTAAWGRSLIAGFLGDREGAVRFLEETRPYGDPLYRHAHRQLAYVSLRNYPPFQRFLKARE